MDNVNRRNAVMFDSNNNEQVKIKTINPMKDLFSKEISQSLIKYQKIRQQFNELKRDESRAS